MNEATHNRHHCLTASFFVAAAGAGSSNQHDQFDLIGMKLTCLKLPLIHAGSS